MNILDDSKNTILTDKNGMLSLINDFPEMMKRAKTFGPSAPIEATPKIDNIVIAGMGGSAISGDIAAKVVSGVSPVPLSVSRDYSIPAFTSGRTLFFALSYSGNTEETLAAYEAAGSRGARIIAITSGGRLADEAERSGYPVIKIPEGLPPRASMPYLLVPLLASLQKADILKDAAAQIDDAISTLEGLNALCREETPYQENPAKKTASSLKGMFPVILGGPCGGDAAAYRWKTQFSENSKITSISNSFPELDHNEIVNLADKLMISQRLKIILLRDDSEQSQMQKRIEVTKKIISKAGGEIVEVWAKGASKLARILSLTYLGDFVSAYLAILNGTDPTPVTAIDELKKELAA